MSSANAKSLSVEPPNRNSVGIGSSVMNDVFSERVSVSQSEMFTISSYVCLAQERRRSRARGRR